MAFRAAVCTSLSKTVFLSNFEELEGIKLREPCQLFKSNERNKKLCTKVDYFLFGHKLSWATAHFIRCNVIKMQSKQVLHNGIKRNKQTYVT